MRKRLLVALVVVSFVLLLVSCTQQPKTTVPATTQTQQFVGSVNSDKYHYPSCRWADKIKSDNLITFSSVSEAKKAGYSPCQTCRPPNQ
ncbi:MAG: hypothetical protein A4E53_00092 [Pelotomaculum sp. PtaB.Bin104]|nr:MAG: hypothetical protein A4E53_00092 [Pelotomaculum sp. PtaB.Bin104]